VEVAALTAHLLLLGLLVGWRWGGWENCGLAAAILFSRKFPGRMRWFSVAQRWSGGAVDQQVVRHRKAVVSDRKHPLNQAGLRASVRAGGNSSLCLGAAS
jgi:hypothetical protein